MNSDQEDGTCVNKTPYIVVSEDGDDFDNEKNDNVPEINKRKRDEEEGHERAECWKDFEKIMIKEDDGVKRKHGKCIHCFKILKADPHKNGTSGLKKHDLKCKKNPKNIALKKQTTLQYAKLATGEASVQTWKHDEVRIKKALLDLFVVGELSFELVQNEAFVEYTNALNGKFTLPSRHTISRDVGKYYVAERNKLLAYLSSPTNTIHLTTDTWTSSCQRVNYMVVTAHFIADDWVMHKRIINFRPIDSHKGDDVGRDLLECIHGWGIKNVMTMTVDNASSNDKASEYLVKKLPNLYADGKHFQVRCMAHILNLIVKDGLKENNYHIECIQKAVRYIRLSTQRITTFKKCMKDCNVESKKFLCGDCPTRWNSTYEMLKIAEELRDVFGEYELEDATYSRLIGRVPGKSDFDNCKLVVGFLEKFKSKTETISGPSKPLAHAFFREMLDVDKHLRIWETKPDFFVMGSAMRKKFDKYWGTHDKINEFMYFAVMLDPTMKTSFLVYVFKKMLRNNETGDNRMTKEELDNSVAGLIRYMETKMEKLFISYKERFEKVGVSSSSQEASNEDAVCCDDGNDFLGEFLHGEENDLVAKGTELKRYLKEEKVLYTGSFDILKWWKQNALRFLIVSRMAKDILAIQISTVASESAFSTSGRILDPYRTSLSTLIVEALVCTQDWVRKSRKPIVDDIDDILKDDDIAKDIEEAVRAQNAKGKGKVTSDD